MERLFYEGGVREREYMDARGRGVLGKESIEYIWARKERGKRRSSVHEERMRE